GARYRSMFDDLLKQRRGSEMLYRRERVTEKTFTSSTKQRSADVMGDEAQVGEFMRVYERADGRLGLLEEYDINGCDARMDYYIEKLYKFACRLREGIGDCFDTLVPVPRKLYVEAAGQGTSDAEG